MRFSAVFAALMSALTLSAVAFSPAASADGLCRAGYSLYDTGSPGAFPDDRNLNGLVCDKVKETRTGFRHWYTDDR